MSDHFHELNVKDVLQKLKTNKSGLSETEAKERLKKHGFNELKEKKKISPVAIFLNQFRSFLVIILIIAAILSFFIIASVIDSIVIIAIVIINAILGFIQEYRAEKTMEALKRLTTPTIFVLRNNKKRQISSKELVPGDMVFLEEGSRIPADMRLIDVAELKIDEAPLTGESTPVLKHVKTIGNVPLAERKNMAFMGTSVASGRGKGVVVFTGMNTEMGSIAEMIQEVEEKQTPLQKKLDNFGKRLGVLIIFVCAVVAIAGILRGDPIMEMIITGIALAVAAIPEGLPAVVTITLAFGMRRMAKKNALVRKLPAVETLGCVTAICADKTGTLTRNEMTVSKIFCNDETIDVTGSGYEPKGNFLIKNKKIDPSKDKTLSLLLKTGVLCNNAELQKNSEWKILGDPTEGALLTVAGKAFDIEKIKKENKRIKEIPFTSERKMMSTVNLAENRKTVFVKGAVETILELCNFIEKGGRIKKMTEKDMEKVLTENKRFAENALRVLGFAYKKFDGEEAESNLIFLGFAGMIDLPRDGVKEDIVLCKKAGIKVVMITGDNKDTARAIAKELNLFDKNLEVLTGSELDKMNNEELKKVVKEANVFARVDPKHKVRILNALKSNGHVVAMTGDGVNDAPALKNADIGVAMGIKGTDVSKEASDMILEDDNFSTIVSAVKDGRQIYDNILKFILYLLSSNTGEVLTVFIGIIIGLPLPVIAVQILWINLATDALPAVALGSEPAERDVMARKPRSSKERILGSNMMKTIFLVGIVMCVGTLTVFYWYLPLSYVYATTMAFTTLVLFQIFNVLNCRSLKKSMFKLGFLSNKNLIYAIIASIALQLIVIYLPVLQTAFSVVALNLMDWIVVILVSCTVFITVEIKKYLESVRGV